MWYIFYSFNNSTGEIGEKQVLINTEEVDLAGSPDGMTIDGEGMLWIAMCHGGMVVRSDPHCRELVKKVELPCVETTACTFGGPNLDRLFVTTGIHKSLEESNAGKVFVIDGLGIRGVSAFPFAG